MQIDTSKWSGEGEFTQVLVDQLQTLEGVNFVRVEDAPASRTEADYNFISNEIFVEFATVRRFLRREKVMAMADLEQRLTALEAVGAPDYSDEGMMQYLRSERIVPPYQTRGYKLVELVRIYEAGTPSRS
jgi:hypothetical protein